MAFHSLKFFVALLVLKYAVAAPADETVQSKKPIDHTQELDLDNDLDTAASNAYPDRYSNWGRYPSGYGSNYGATGYGTIDDKYNYGSTVGGGYENSYGYDSGYPGYSGYSGGAGYGGYSKGGSNTGSYGYGGNGGYVGYSGNGGYGTYSGNGAYGTYSGNGGYGTYSGNGGYGGNSGNGGLTSYYGYNNPTYQGGNHLGYGYYKRPGYGNIYNSGITPNLVTGYRGYSRK